MPSHMSVQKIATKRNSLAEMLIDYILQRFSERLYAEATLKKKLFLNSKNPSAETTVVKYMTTSFNSILVITLMNKHELLKYGHKPLATKVMQQENQNPIKPMKFVKPSLKR